ncbi:MAG: hypothetical protein AB8F78_00490 [Saprospiraceae bacterium]
MKYLPYAIALLIFTLLQVNLKAQDSKTEEAPTHKRFVGGSISFFRAEGNTGNLNFNSFNSFITEESRVSFKPYFGFQSGKKTEIGVIAGISLSKRRSDFLIDKTKSRVIELGFFLRNYLIQKGDFSFFLQSNVIGSYESGRITDPFSSLQEEADFEGPYMLTFRLNPRISYDLNRFRFLATIGNAGFTVSGEAKDENDTIISLGGSTIFANALTNGLGLSVEYKF